MRSRGHKFPHSRVDGDFRVSQEGHRRPAVQGSVLYLGLAGEVVRGVDGGDHAVHGEEGRQVGRVGGDQDQGEEPPDSTWTSEAKIIIHFHSRKFNPLDFFCFTFR